MPDITNPQLVQFANTRIRPCADSAEQMYQTMKRLQQEFVAYNGSTIPNTTDLFADGSATDGRKPMTGALATAFKSLVDALVSYFETSVTIGGVAQTRIVWLQQISVNGGPRF